MICPRSAILHSAAASSVAGIFELTVSTAARIATFGVLHTEGHGEIDGVLADVDLVLQRRRDVDRRVGDDQDLVVGRDVHDEHVADASAGAQPRLLGHDGTQQLVAVQAALHQQLGLALTNQFHRLCRRGMAVRRVDNPESPRGRSRSSSRSPGSCRRPDENRRDEPFSPASIAPASAVSSQGWATAVGTGSRLRHLASSASYFPVPVARFMAPDRQQGAYQHSGGETLDEQRRMLQDLRQIRPY